MTKTIRMAYVLVALVLGTAAVGHAEPGIACSLVDAAPTVDGRLDDSAWAKIVATPLVGIAGEPDAQPATRFRLCTDVNWLYIAVESADPAVKDLPLEKGVRDEVNWNETVEIFFAPDVGRPLYYHFAVDPSGTLYDNIGQSGATDNNFGWRCTVQVGNDGWTAEMALPLKELSLPQGLTQGDATAFNLCRTAGRGRTRLQGWSPTGGSYHRRTRFGTLIVGSLSAEAGRRARELEARYMALKDNVGNEDPLAKEIEQALALLKSQAATETSAEWERFQETFGRTEKRIRLLSGRGVDKLVMWRGNPWSLPAKDAALPEDVPPDSLQLTALQGEYLSVALVVANPTDQPVRLRCLAEALRATDWQELSPDLSPLSLHRVSEVALRGGGTQRDPLPVMRIEDELVVLPGENEILWLTVDTHGLAPGAWSSRVRFVPLVRYGLRCDMTLTLRVLPAALPQGPRPYSGNWAHYQHPPSGGKIRRACGEDQKKHYTSVHNVPPGEAGLRSIKFDAEGRPLNEPDFSLLDSLWLDVFGSDRQLYGLATRYRSLPAEMDGVGPNAEQERETFARYAQAIRRHFEERGVGVSDFAWYVTDEPDVARAGLAARLGELLHAADPEQQMFATLYSSTPVEALRILLPYVNVWVPAFSSTKEQMDLLRTQGLPSRFLSYNVHSRTTPPHRYRLSAATAWQLGYDGIGFWCYDDAGGTRYSSTWTDLDDENPSDSRGMKRSDYAIIYEGSDGPVPSVRWEAWRHGVQDFRYLDWLTALADDCTDKALAAEAKLTVSEGVAAITKGGDSALPDRFNDRARIMAVRLLGAAGEISAEAVDRVTAPLPFCLTDNGRFLAPAGLGGSYRYNKAPTGTHGDRPSAGEWIPFATTETAAAGKMTDRNLKYPDGWAIHNHPPDPWTLTFDLAAQCRLDTMLIFIDPNPAVHNYKSMAVEVSDATEDGPWNTVYQIDLSDITSAPLTHDTALKVPLAGRQGRFLRLIVGTCGEASRLGEVRIIGWPAVESMAGKQ